MKCSNCKEDKDKSDFYFRKSENRYQSYCKKCLLQYQIDRWKNRKLEAIQYKGGCCISCGYNKYYGALEFHHVNPEDKDFDWRKLRLRSWNSITEELDKCVLLCSNCHKEIHNELVGREGIEPSTNEL